MRISQDGRPARDLGHGADRRRDDRAGARHHLEYRQTESLVERRINQKIGRPVELGCLLIRHGPHEDDVLADSELTDEVAQF
jgi:hypothetical protein